MKIFKFFNELPALALAAMVMSPVAAGAATYTVDGVAAESRNSVPAGVVFDTITRDLNRVASDDIFHFSDGGELFGRISGGIDAFMIDGGVDNFALNIGAQHAEPGFMIDVSVVGDGVDFFGTLTDGDDLFTLTGLTGFVEVSLAGRQNINLQRGAIWNVGVSDVAPVPLPAAGLLLLGSLGSLAALHRRRKVA